MDKGDDPAKCNRPFLHAGQLGFWVELNYIDQKISSEKINERINALTNNERSIMEAIEKNPRITQAQLAESLNLTGQYIRELMRNSSFRPSESFSFYLPLIADGFHAVSLYPG